MQQGTGIRNEDYSDLVFPSVSGNISSETVFAINTFKTNEDPMAKQGVGGGVVLGECLFVRSV